MDTLHTGEAVNDDPQKILVPILVEHVGECPVEDIVEYVEKNGKLPDGLIRTMLRDITDPETGGKIELTIAGVNHELDILVERLDLSEIQEMVERSRKRIQKEIGDGVGSRIVHLSKVKIWKYIQKTRQVLELIREWNGEDQYISEKISGIHIDIGEKNIPPSVDNWNGITVAVDDTKPDTKEWIEMMIPLSKALNELFDKLQHPEVSDSKRVFVHFLVQAIRTVDTVDIDFSNSPMRYIEKCMKLEKELSENRKIQHLLDRLNLDLTVNMGISENDEITSPYEMGHEVTIDIDANVSIQRLMQKIIIELQKKIAR